MDLTSLAQGMLRATRTEKTKRVAAPHACPLYLKGMRHEAYPSVMPTLWKLGVVVSRSAFGPSRKFSAWFIPEEGRVHLAEIDASKSRRFGIGWRVSPDVRTPLDGRPEHDVRSVP